METRSGHLENPGETWSDWEGLQAGRISSPASRFLQWRLTLAGKAAERTFKVGSIQIPYRGANRAPRIKSVVVESKANMQAGNGNGGTPGRFSQSMPGGVKIDYTVEESGDPPAESNMRSTDWVRQIRTASWKVSEPDGDCLRYDLFLRFTDEEDYFPLTQDLENSAYSWDASAWPEGWYELKVVARDEECNPPGEGLEDVRISAPFRVDNTPPEFSDLKLSWRQGTGEAELILSGICSDKQSRIAGLEISLNGERWRFIQPEDGLFDTPREHFSVTVPEKKDGVRPTFVGVRGIDEMGHFITARVRVPKK